MKKNLLYQIIFFVSIVILLLFSFIENRVFDDNEDVFLTIIFGVNFISTLAFLFKREPNISLRKQYLKHSYIFLIGFSIVHFQFYIDYFLGNFTWTEMIPYFMSKTIFQKGVCLSGIALNCFYFGYITKVEREIKTPSVNCLNLYKIGNIKNTIIYVCILFFVLYYLNTNPAYFVGGYEAINRNYFSTTFEYLFQISIFIYIILHGIENQKYNFTFVKYVKSYHIVVLAMIGFYLLSVLTSGDRGPIIYIGLAFVSNYYFITRKKIKFVNLIILVIISSLFLTFAAMLRSKDLAGESLSYRISHTLKHGQTYRLSGRSIIPKTFELAQSVRSYHAGIYYIDYLNNEHTYGLTTFYQSLSVIPGAGYLFKEFTNLDQSELSSALIVTETLDADHGMGTSCIADVYMDLGEVGVIFCFLFFGAFCRNCEVWAYAAEKNNIFHYVASIILIALAIYIGRSNFFALLRPIVFSYFIIMIVSSITKTKTKIKNK